MIYAVQRNTTKHAPVPDGGNRRHAAAGGLRVDHSEDFTRRSKSQRRSTVAHATASSRRTIQPQRLVVLVLQSRSHEGRVQRVLCKHSP
jgi:hypothetical protein